jgi:hypothetical protein
MPLTERRWRGAIVMRSPRLPRLQRVLKKQEADSSRSLNTMFLNTSF